MKSVTIRPVPILAVIGIVCVVCAFPLLWGLVLVSPHTPLRTYLPVTDVQYDVYYADYDYMRREITRDTLAIAINLDAPMQQVAYGPAPDGSRYALFRRYDGYAVMFVDGNNDDIPDTVYLDGGMNGDEQTVWTGPYYLTDPWELTSWGEE